MTSVAVQTPIMLASLQKKGADSDAALTLDGNPGNKSQECSQKQRKH